MGYTTCYHSCALFREAEQNGEVIHLFKKNINLQRGNKVKGNTRSFYYFFCEGMGRKEGKLDIFSEKEKRSGRISTNY